ncbi:uncharacterized protein METZ01_LOCUS319035 [marine metagenome]|uniref:Uncharacterized protein n=1 Tax=marine metagenome TaxID=408172 RepID=A0A382P2W8_9ZZZZ
MVQPRTNYSTKTAEAIRSNQAPGHKFSETAPTRLAEVKQLKVRR